VQLLRVFGVRIGVHPSWFLVLFLIIWSLSGTYKDAFPGRESQAFFLATLSALLFFASVVLHELGHALVAKRNGIGIAGIDLWLFGGVAKMRRDTDSAGVEFRVAVAGPLVTLAIAALCAGAGILLAGFDSFLEAVILAPDSGNTPLEAVLGYLAFINTVLLAFNLLPGFPLDGGRIVRAIAWWRTGDRTKATRFAALLGRGLAYVLMGLGAFALLNGQLVGGLWLVFIGVFLNGAARHAVSQTAVSERIEGLTVGDVMDDEPVALSSLLKLDRALDEFFLRYGWAWFPVVDGAGRFVGYVTRTKVEEVPEALRAGWTVDEVMNHESAASLEVAVEEPLESLLGSEGFVKLGAVMAVDGEGRLRGVVTLDQVRRALRPAAPAV